VDGRLRYWFGVIYVDFETLERTPKLSAEWFREAGDGSKAQLSALTALEGSWQSGDNRAIWDR
jgi:hypothetical protein